MSTSSDEDAAKLMELEWGSHEDPEMVLAELRKCHLVEKFFGGKQSTDRIHEILKSYGKFSGLVFSQRLKVRKLWSLLLPEARASLLLEAHKNGGDMLSDAIAGKQCNTHSDEMARVGHLLSYPGATYLVTRSRSSMDRATLDTAHLGSESDWNYE